MSGWLYCASGNDFVCVEDNGDQWQGMIILYNGVGVLAESLHRVGPMDSLQVFVKEYHTTLGIETRPTPIQGEIQLP